MTKQEEIKEHIEHEMEFTTWDDVVIFLKCLDCDEVLIDSNTEGEEWQLEKR